MIINHSTFRPLVSQVGVQLGVADNYGDIVLKAMHNPVHSETMPAQQYAIIMDARQTRVVARPWPRANAWGTRSPPIVSATKNFSLD